MALALQGHGRYISSMSTDLTALFVAVVGVCGTLTAPLLVQRAAERSRRLDAALERDVRAEEKLSAEARVQFEERRELYTDLNAQARQTRALYKDVARLPAANDAEFTAAVTAANEARLRFLGMYNRAQMMLSEDLLILVSTVNLLLGQGYGLLKNVTNEDSEARAHIRAFCDGDLYAAIWTMREHMRKDLGVIRATAATAPAES